MNSRMTVFTTAVGSVVITGLALLSGTATADNGELQLDRTVATQGDSVRVFARCAAEEQLGVVGSEAFAPTGGAQDGPFRGGVTFTKQVNGGATGTATIRSDTAPGTYRVDQRCGGGNAGGVDLTVLSAG